MQKTVISHFYNEEYLLPWWLNHHKAIFDHGIMIDYASTDRSINIIRELCPSWQIVPSRNAEFDAYECDKEVSDYEGIIKGWRMALNVTEFLYGNYNHLNDSNEDQQIIVGNFVFTDMEDDKLGPVDLDHNVPLHQQRYWGYHHLEDAGGNRSGRSVRRQNRSLQNYPMDYMLHPGRHFGHVAATVDDLVIFYYGWAFANEQGLARKTQIQNRMSKFDIDRNSGGHVATKNDFFNRIRVDHQPKSRDLRQEIDKILKFNKDLTGQEF